MAGQQRRKEIATILLLLITAAPLAAQRATAVEPSENALSNVRGLDLTVGSVIQSARRRLETAPCQRIFSDFTDPSGRPLQARLDELGESGASYLERLFFYNGRAEGPCAQDSILAVTVPGSRVVFVCGRFVDRIKKYGKSEAIIVIHEELHSLGLTENPPSSVDITRQVSARCGAAP
jgi:hypothetical protein